MRLAAARVCLRFCLTAAVARGSGCRCRAAGLIQFLLRHHFPFSHKNNSALLMVLTAHQIPSTVFPPSPASFYSSGYFILGICKACFGRGKTYCFISGCAAFMSMLRLRSGRGEDVVPGVPVCCPAVFAQRGGAPHSTPLQCRATPRVGSQPRVGQRPARGGRRGAHDTGSSSGENI